MKSSYWTLCLAALFLCFTSGSTFRNLGQEDNFLDRRKNQDIIYRTNDDEIRTPDPPEPTCEGVECGEDADCEIDPEEKVPWCKCVVEELFFDKEDTKCKVEACLGTVCGKDSSCKLNPEDNNEPFCKCENDELKFDEMDKECKATCDDVTESKKCKNGGSCIDKNSLKVCSCLKGTSGSFCETVDECKDLSCGNDAMCGFDIVSEKAKCKCNQIHLSFDETEKKCKNTCDDVTETKKCKNGGSCIEKNSLKVCSCKKGTSGSFCETVDECKVLSCGNDATCGFDTVSEKAKCKCNQIDLSFDETEKKCKNTCDDITETKKCKNGGSCIDKNSLKLCSCIKGTSGSFCETVDKCKDLSCGNAATCGFDTVSKKAKCKCNQADLSFDEKDKKCKIEACVGLECGEDANCKVVAEKKTRYCECNNNSLKFDGKDKKCKVAVCVGVECGEDAICEVDTASKSPSCKCTDNDLKFDKRDKKCKAEGCLTKNCGKEANCVVGAEGKDVLCECRNTTLSFDEKNLKCKVDYCKENCGDNTGVNCDPKKKYNKAVQCTCEDKEHSFDKSDKTCKEDYCKKKCSSISDVDCEDAKKFEEDVSCTCKDKSKSFDEIHKECKVDYCRKKCGNAKGVECDDELKFNETVECTCDEHGKSFDAKDKTCKDCSCGPNGKCKFVLGKKRCTCDEDYTEENGECKEDFCKKNCGYDSSVKCEQSNKFVEDVKCQCKASSKVFLEEEKICKATCSKDTDCENDGECSIEQGNDKFCECLDGTSGEKCRTVHECQPNAKWGKCNDKKGKCIFNTTTKAAECTCNQNQKPSEVMGFCVDTCDDEKKNCAGKNRICKDGLCICKDGYGGEDCTDLTGCTPALKEHCTKNNATCVYDDEKPFATCKCGEDYTYKNSKCISNYCVKYPCNDGLCALITGKVGLCVCGFSMYYDYNTKKCVEPDKCLLRKEPCKVNEVCKDGICECAPGFEKSENDCKKKVCDPELCFPGAECSGENCTCKEDWIYVNNECKGRDCLSEDYETKCDCPSGFDRKEDNKKCDPEGSNTKCAKDCGYGYCLKAGDKEECSCFKSEYIHKENNKCVLKADACASGNLTKDSMKCECNGIYKQAKDKITCELVTCEDSSLQKLCSSYNAQCKMLWKDVPKSRKLEDYCVCHEGYFLDSAKKTCTDFCSLETSSRECRKHDQFCYNWKGEDNKQHAVADCRCPPPLHFDTDNKKCSLIAKYSYLIKDIPVMKAKYMRGDKVDYVLLNSDIVDSLTQTYNKETFNYGYLHDYKLDGETLKCTVWVDFKVDPSMELKRINLVSEKFGKDACADEKNCNLNQVIWPPRILMPGSDLNEVTYENLTLCTDFAKDSLCGHDAMCKDDKCSCPDGFRAPVTTIKDYGGIVIQRCEDINECAEKTGSCPENTKCVNTHGSYKCVCDPGFKKVEETSDENDKGKCTGLCSPSPCIEGSCSVVNNTTFDCKCKPGFAGPLCDRKDLNLASAKKQVVVVGAVLGTILGIALIAFVVFYMKIRKSSHSQDFTPTPRRDNAEMMERRPMRGVVNKSYE